MENRGYDITVIGGAILDVLARPVSAEVFRSGSQAVEETRLSFGGDALNESVVLSRLGKRVELVSLLGEDPAGGLILAYCGENGVETGHIAVEPGLATGINLVLTDQRVERCFLTNPSGSLRRLGPAHIPAGVPSAGLVCFASIFVSPVFDIPAMAALFARVKAEGRTLCADITKAKRGETLADLAPAARHLDYLFPNLEEARRITGLEDPDDNADALLGAGVGCAVVKLGGAGCLIKTGDRRWVIPSYPVERCVDTTGAGDTFAAGFLWALSEGWDLPDCGRFACAAASCTVEHLGATDAVRSLEQVMARFERMK